MGALDSAASLAAAGGNPLVAAAITGSGSAAQSARAAHEAGADDMAAMQYGAAIGAVEGLSGMVDVGTMAGAYRSVRGSASQSARNFLLGQLANAGAQGLSEGLTQAAEIALADSILGEYSENNALRAQMRAAGASEAEIERAIRSLNAARVGQAALSGALLGPVFDVGGRLVGGAVNAATGHAPQMGAGGDSSRGFSLRPEDGLSSLYDFAPARDYGPAYRQTLPGVYTTVQDSLAQRQVSRASQNNTAFGQWLDKLQGLSNNGTEQGTSPHRGRKGKYADAPFSIPVYDADGKRVATVPVSTAKVPDILRQTKPKGSPVPDEWYKKGGTMFVAELGGDPVWFYTSKDGVTVPYIGGEPDFAVAGCVYGELDVGAFANRNRDKSRANQMFNRSIDFENFVWHHVNDMRTMQIVDRKIHSLFTHYGGNYGAHKGKSARKNMKK